MPSRIIDLRSDTATLPSAPMRRAMAEAEVGDDMLGEDPTVNRLEARIAEMLGKESAIFTPSGTMANQLRLEAHTEPGDEVLCEETAHVYVWEGGAPALLSGVTCRTIRGRRGILDAADFEGLVRPKNMHYSQTRLVCIENSHNRGNGSIYPPANIERIAGWARQHGLSLHLDGARLFNAVVATGISADRWAKPVDTVSICFSKGLGAPVGSALIGSAEFIAKARRYRKVFGGAMRQAGILAAACLYALDHNIERLNEDHEHAQLLARAIAQTNGFRLDPKEIETNIIWIPFDSRLGSTDSLVRGFASTAFSLAWAVRASFECARTSISPARMWSGSSAH